MKRFVAITLTIACAATLLVARHADTPVSTIRATATPTSSPSVAPTPGPLTIAAIRAHPIGASQIKVTQSLAARGGCATQVVSFTSDGLTEYALMNTPASAKPATGYPVVVLAHGYINPSGYQTAGTDYEGFTTSFCQAGYLVLKLDYRGNGQSQGSPTTGDLDPGYSYDVLNLTASIGSLPVANAQEIAWLGHSMGGAVVLRAAVASHNLPVKAIILASGVVGSLEDTFITWPKLLPLPADLTAIQQQITATYGAPPAHPEFWHDASAINYLSAVTAPVQINHGTADKTVPIAFSQALDAAMTAAGKTHTFITYPGGDHQYSVASARTAFTINAIAFLNANLK